MRLRAHEGSDVPALGPGRSRALSAPAVPAKRSRWRYGKLAHFVKNIASFGRRKHKGDQLLDASPAISSGDTPIPQVVQGTQATITTNGMCVVCVSVCLCVSVCVWCVLCVACLSPS